MLFGEDEFERNIWAGEFGSGGPVGKLGECKEFFQRSPKTMRKIKFEICEEFKSTEKFKS